MITADGSAVEESLPPSEIDQLLLPPARVGPKGGRDQPRSLGDHDPLGDDRHHVSATHPQRTGCPPRPPDRSRGALLYDRTVRCRRSPRRAGPPDRAGWRTRAGTASVPVSECMAAGKPSRSMPTSKALQDTIKSGPACGSPVRLASGQAAFPVLAHQHQEQALHRGQSARPSHRGLVRLCVAVEEP